MDFTLAYVTRFLWEKISFSVRPDFIKNEKKRKKTKSCISKVSIPTPKIYVAISTPYLPNLAPNATITYGANIFPRLTLI